MKMITKQQTARMQEALHMVKNVIPKPTQNGISSYIVSSQTTSNKSYEVKPFDVLGRVFTCTCLDYQNRGTECKHILAVKLFKECVNPEIEERRAASKVSSSETLAREALESRYLNQGYLLEVSA